MRNVLIIVLCALLFALFAAAGMAESREATAWNKFRGYYDNARNSCNPEAYVNSLLFLSDYEKAAHKKRDDLRGWIYNNAAYCLIQEFKAKTRYEETIKQAVAGDMAAVDLIQAHLDLINNAAEILSLTNGLKLSPGMLSWLFNRPLKAKIASNKAFCAQMLKYAKIRGSKPLK